MKVRIKPLYFDSCNVEMPYGELQAVKLSLEQAMQFSRKNVTSFSNLLEKYGKNNRMRAGEYYNGYLVIFYWWGRAELVRMRGLLDKSLSGKGLEGCLELVLSINDCCFASFIEKMKLPVTTDATTIDKALKDKLIKAQTTEEKIVTLENDEEQVLRQYFGSYFDKIFTVVTY